MSSELAKGTSGQIQKGYRAVPISTADEHSPLRLCVIVREAPDPIAGMFVLLRDNVDSAIYLACLIDAGGYVHQWIELWLQNVNNFQTSLKAYREAISNYLLDERWKRRAAFFGRQDRVNKIQIPWENAHPLPIYFDLSVSAPVNPLDPTLLAPWELCTDDQILEQHGLQRYTTSLARYLSIRGAPKSPFLPMTDYSPENEWTQDAKQVFAQLIPLNPDGGLMLARKFAPLGFETYLGVLGGQPWKGLDEGSKVFKLSGVYDTLQNADTVQQGGAHLFLGKRGSAGRLVETFHLKLNLILQTFRLVRDFVRDEQLPLLNLSADSFRVALAETSSSLPYLWTAKVTLSTWGAAFALPLETSEARYFFTSGDDATSIYRPITPTMQLNSRGAVRIRKVLSQTDETVVLEGTISTQERLDISQTDLLWIRLTLSSGRVDLYANLTEGGAQGEQRFRTFPQKLPEHIVIAIRSAEGLKFPSVPFETLPLRSSPCDLYSLAVVAVRTLLVNEDNSLAIALDEIASLAQSIGPDISESREIYNRIRSLAASDPRWAASLGPHRLLKAQSLTAEEALSYLPSDLWWDTIGVITQCFPGPTPGAYCTSLGDAPPLALHTIFDQAVQALEMLFMRSRSLLFVDWKYNSEINSIISAALERHKLEAGAQA